MELLRGETLASQMDKKRRFSQEETLTFGLPLLSALAHAHAQGIVHRDLKPENIFLSVDPDGHVIPKILDFGISKLLQPAVPRITTDGVMLGTPSYMSPEQARGLPNVDARSDVFAAGILLYEMLSGVSPFASGSYHSVVAAILERDPEPLKRRVSPELWRVIKRALEKPAALRYADAGELASALRARRMSDGARRRRTHRAPIRRRASRWAIGRCRPRRSASRSRLSRRSTSREAKEAKAGVRAGLIGVGMAIAGVRWRGAGLLHPFVAGSVAGGRGRREPHLFAVERAALEIPRSSSLRRPGSFRPRSPVAARQRGGPAGSQHVPGRGRATANVGAPRSVRRIPPRSSARARHNLRLHRDALHHPKATLPCKRRRR